MNSKVKGVLQVLLVLVLIAAFAFVAARGIGGAHRGSAKNIRLGLDLEGGVSVTYQAYKTDSTGKRTGEQPTDKDMADTIYKMQKRVETLESTEAAVYQEGSDRVTIDIPGASDSEEVLKELGKAGALYFILYSDLKTEKGGTPNEGDKVVYDKSKVLLTGDMIGEATSGSRQQEGTGKTEYGVSIKFAGKGIKKFAKITGEHVGEQLAIVYDEKLVSAPNLKEEISGRGFDMMIMRELTGGLYFGARKTEEVDGVLTATDTLTYNENEIRRIAKRGFDIAMKRRKKVTSVDKANVLDSSRLWRKIVEEVAQDYPEVTYEHMLVDNCAMQLVKDPKQFDVILTENMFGDILSDEASMVTGSIGMLSSASLNDTKFGLYEPSGGSAPDIAGKGIANPIATILSAAMMLRYSFDLDREADAVEQAVKQVLKDGYRTIDIMPQEKQQEKATQVGTAQMGDLICERIR